jgi:hypothetical protein
MDSMRRIIILVHRDGQFDVAYFLHAIADVWQENGLQVIVQRGPGPHVEADVAILHVDLTVVPPDHLDFIRRYPVAMNGAVADTSKRRISANIVRRGDGYDGQVIIKTNRNYGGWREADLAARRSIFRRYARALRRRLPWPLRTELEISQYPVLPSAARVPWMVWHNPDLVVERFQPEMRDGCFCLRTWVFLGDRETNSLSYSKQPIVKSENVIRRDTVADVPDELRRIRRELGFDFGKFDYAIVGDRVVLYDANRTPTLGNFPREQYLPRVRQLAEGIGAFM